MGVDYRANWGFGVRIQIPKDVDDEFGFIQALVKNTNYGFIQDGSWYTNEEIYYYITHERADESLKSGNYDLRAYKDQLLEFLDSRGIEYIGNPSIVGGLLIS